MKIGVASMQYDADSKLVLSTFLQSLDCSSSAM